MATVRINGVDRVQQEGLTLGVLREGYSNSYVHLVPTSSPDTDLRLDATPLVSGAHYTMIMTPRLNYASTVVHNSGGSNGLKLELNVRLLDSTDHAAGQETGASNGSGLQQLSMVTPKNQSVPQQPAEKKRKLQQDTIDTIAGETDATFKSPCSRAVSTRRKPVSPLVDPLHQVDETFRADWEHLRRIRSKGKLDLSDFTQVMKQLKHSNNNWRVVPADYRDPSVPIMWTRMPGLKKEYCSGYRKGFDYFVGEAQLQQCICAQACLLCDGELVSAVQRASAEGYASRSPDQADGDVQQDRVGSDFLGGGDEGGGPGAFPLSQPTHATGMTSRSAVKAPKPSATSSAFDLCTQPTPALQLPVQQSVPVVAPATTSAGAGACGSAQADEHSHTGSAATRRMSPASGHTGSGEGVVVQAGESTRDSDLHTAHSEDSDTADEQATQHSLCSGSDDESLQSVASCAVGMDGVGGAACQTSEVRKRSTMGKGAANDYNRATGGRRRAADGVDRGCSAPTQASSDAKEHCTCTFCTLENSAITDPTECSNCGYRRNYGTRRTQQIAASQQA